MTRGIDRTGQRFGTIIITARAPSPEGEKHWCWHYQCDCGVTGIISAKHLRDRQSCNSCSRKRRNRKVTRHGHATGGKRSALYQTWLSMRQRCLNPNHDAWLDYGGRGVAVCVRWNDFENFLADVPPKPGRGYQLDRIDNNGDYAPGNVRWALPKQNNRNRRSNLLLTFKGRTLCMTEWAEETGLPATTLKQRLQKGWDTEKALTTPWTPRHLRNKKQPPTDQSSS